jgi:hypothetical protein
MWFSNLKISNCRESKFSILNIHFGARFAALVTLPPGAPVALPSLPTSYATALPHGVRIIINVKLSKVSQLQAFLAPISNICRDRKYSKFRPSGQVPEDYKLGRGRSSSASFKFVIH